MCDEPRSVSVVPTKKKNIVVGGLLEVGRCDDVTTILYSTIIYII